MLSSASTLLDLQLQEVASQLQIEVAPGVGADIVLVWRDAVASAPVAGGAGVDAYGIRMTTGGTSSRPDQRAALVQTLFGRLTPSGGAPQEFGGQLVDVSLRTWEFNERDTPLVMGGDVLTRTVKRDDSQTPDKVGWQANTVYAQAAREMPANVAVLTAPAGRAFYIAVTGGVSGSVEPVWPGKNGQVNDGTIQWHWGGLLEQFEVKDAGGRATVPVIRLVRCVEVRV